MPYATPAQFTAKFGLQEATQQLQDEERLLTSQLLTDALAGTWTGNPTAEEQAAAAAALARLTDEISTQSTIMDGYLRAAVTLPLPVEDANNAALRDCCLALSRCGIADDCDNSTEKMEAACDTWRKWLKDIAAGRVQLVNPDGTQPVATGRMRSGQAASGYDWTRFGGGGG